MECKVMVRDRWRKILKRLGLVLGLVVAVLVVVGARPVFHLLKTTWNDANEKFESKPGTANDASRLNETSVVESWKIPAEPDAAEKQLAVLLEEARAKHLKVSIAGARHSMGGHTIARDGIVIDMLPFNRMELDKSRMVLHVQAGARWSEIIPFLNKAGYSVEIMQSNDDFSIGGSLSVNCHGWQFNRPPIDSSVETMRIMLANGEVVKCSRTERPEMFSLVLGGYGLIGIILDADLHIVPNEKYRIERWCGPSSDYAKVLSKKTAESPDLVMAYGRLCVTREKFLE